MFAEIPGPTRKAPPPKHNSPSDTNEISSKTSKNQPSSGKESHLQSVKNNFQNPDYEDYNSNESEDFDPSLGD